MKRRRVLSSIAGALLALTAAGTTRGMGVSGTPCSIGYMRGLLAALEL